MYKEPAKAEKDENVEMHTDDLKKTTTSMLFSNYRSVESIVEVGRHKPGFKVLEGNDSIEDVSSFDSSCMSSEDNMEKIDLKVASDPDTFLQIPEGPPQLVKRESSICSPMLI
jgi:hypothetical protein